MCDTGQARQAKHAQRHLHCVSCPISRGAGSFHLDLRQIGQALQVNGPKAARASTRATRAAFAAMCGFGYLAHVLPRLPLVLFPLPSGLGLFPKSLGGITAVVVDRPLMLSRLPILIRGRALLL